MFKSFVQAIRPVYTALGGAQSELLAAIRDLCHPEKIQPTIDLIASVINNDVAYQRTPLDLRNQRTYAVKVCIMMICGKSN